MPATALTKVTALGFGRGVVNAVFQAVDQPNGNSFVNTGRTIFLLTRTATGGVAPTFALTASKYTANDAITKTPATPVALNTTGVYGPFPTAIYGSAVTVNFDTGASVTAAVVELEDTPL